jgi:hypothetical protein
MLKTSYIILTGTEKVKDSSLPGSYPGMTCKWRHYGPTKHWDLSTTRNGITAPKALNIQQQHCGTFFTCSDYKGVWVSKRIPPLILHLRTKCRSVVCFTTRETLPLQKKPPILIEWVAGLAPESAWAFRKREKSLALAGKVTSPQPSYYTDCAIPTHAIPPWEP